MTYLNHFLHYNKCIGNCPNQFRGLWGISQEREISLLTGNEIVENLNKDKYDVMPVFINSQYELIDKVKHLDFGFIALHGNFGEDGKVQSHTRKHGNFIFCDGVYLVHYAWIKI